MMSSKKGVKIGIIAKTILVFLTPNYIGSLFFKLFPSATPDNVDRFVTYAVGIIVFVCLFLVTWIIRAVLIWFTDDTGEKDPWKWGWFLNDE